MSDQSKISGQNLKWEENFEGNGKVPITSNAAFKTIRHNLPSASGVVKGSASGTLNPLNFERALKNKKTV